MSEHKKCPKCGAAELPYPSLAAYFGCGSFIDSENSEFFQSRECKEDAAWATLTAENTLLAGIVRAVGEMVACECVGGHNSLHEPNCPIRQAEEWVTKNPAEQDSSDKDGGT